MIYLYMNEQHSLLPVQKQLLTDKFGDKAIITVLIPSEGWDKAQIHEQVMKINFGDEVVILSPVPVLVGWMAAEAVQGDHGGKFGLYCFYNEKRIAKEVTNPDGTTRIAHVLQPDGWELVTIN